MNYCWNEAVHAEASVGPASTVTLKGLDLIGVFS